MISKEVIEQIKAQVDILDIVGDYVNLKKVGHNYRGLSPFNQEKSPSFYVVPHKGFYKDFSSGKGGDAIAFLMELEGLSYMEAIRQLGKKYGIDIVEEEEQSDEALEAQNERDSLFIAMNYASTYFKEMLQTDEGKALGLSYLKERKFSDEIIESFGLGYSTDAWDGLLKTAEKKGYRAEILEKAGLVIKKQKDNGEDRYYDRFRGRVMFPVHNVSGKIIAFGGRILKKNADPKFQQPKYINSPETPIYHKSDVLYGMFQSKNQIRQKDNCFLVEGYTDVISMHQAGITNAVASSGTSLTPEQIRLIRRFTENVTVIFDGDAAGIKASFRGIDLILEGGLNVKAISLPQGEDPDSMAKNLGTSGFRDYLESHVQDFITFKTSIYANEVKNDPIRRAETIREVVSSIAKIPDPIKRQVYTKECSVLLNIDENTLIAEQNRIHLKDQKNQQNNQRYSPEDMYGEPVVEDEPLEPVEKKQDPDDKITLQERESIRLLISYGFNEIEESYRLYDYLLEELKEVELTTPIYRKILEIFKEKLNDGKVIDSEYLITHGDPEVQQEVINLELMAERYKISQKWESEFNIYVPHETDLLHHVVYTNILRLKFRMIEKLIHGNQNDMRQAKDEEALLMHQKMHMALKKSQMEIANQLGNVVS